jgi:plastocyanin
VTGRVSVLEKGDRAATDVDQAVVWLVGSNAPPAAPDTVEMATENKQFVPRLVLLPVGSTVAFPNHDPFNHNVFSLSPEQPFDLGLYGRGGAKTVTFGTAGIVRVYCNVHAQMRALIMVRETGLVTQPGADGSFRVDQVPPGDYVVHLWHERAPEVTQPLRVGAAPPPPLSLTLDARGYRFRQHKDKNGKSYADRSRRY